MSRHEAKRNVRGDKLRQELESGRIKCAGSMGSG
jgi:hypothetical protein